MDNRSSDFRPLYNENEDEGMLHLSQVKTSLEPTSINLQTQQQTLPPLTKRVFVGPQSSLVECPYCNAVVKTTVKYTVTTRTHMLACLLTNLCCCSCLPYCCCNSAKNTDHYCANCTRFLGTYEK